MRIIAVDDERLSLRAISNAVREVLPDAQVHCFLKPRQAVDYARENPVDIAFLDIEMGVMSGLELAKALKDIHGQVNIIFVTGFSQYALDAFSVSASGYLLKPVDAGSVRRELENLRHPMPAAPKGVRIQAFGNFEVFVNNRPVAFRRTKSKEVLAYLVDRRGAGVTKKELAAVLWGDQAYSKSNQVYLQMLVSEMIKALTEAGAGDIIIRRRNSLSIDTTKVECDYYDYLKWKPGAVNAYQGEYMANYSWAEFTIGLLEEHLARQ